MSSPAEQIPLPGFGETAAPVRRSRTRLQYRVVPTPVGEDRLLATYLRRLAARGAAPKGFSAYRYQLHCLLAVAERHAGRTINIHDLMRDASLLGRALVDDVAPASGRQLSRWTLAQRRSAVRSFVSLMQPELAAFLNEDPHDVLDRALRCVARRVGTGYRLTGGSPRRRGGYAPPSAEIDAVIEAAGQGPGFISLRDAVFFSILAKTGTRVNALRELDGTDCVTMPSGHIRLFVHAKGKDEEREIELDHALSNAFRAYADAFNQHSTVNGWRVRIGVGQPGPAWRNGARGRWSYQTIRTNLRAACARADVEPFSPHALRRGFATNAATTLPRHVVALAGGWQGLERLDDHYIQPRKADMMAKLESATEMFARRERDGVSDTAVNPLREPATAIEVMSAR